MEVPQVGERRVGERTDSPATHARRDMGVHSSLWFVSLCLTSTPNLSEIPILALLTGEAVLYAFANDDYSDILYG